MGYNRHVQTDMGDQGARLMGRDEAPTTLDDSVRGICARVCCHSPELPRRNPRFRLPTPGPLASAVNLKSTFPYAFFWFRVHSGERKERKDSDADVRLQCRSVRQPRRRRRDSLCVMRMGRQFLGSRTIGMECHGRCLSVFTWKNLSLI